MMMIKQLSFLLFCLFLFVPNRTNGQQLVREGNHYLNVPELKAIESTPLHFYAVSNQDGLLLFRNYDDSLSFLLTLDAFAGTSRTFKADIRFGYLFGGDDTRVTVIDPTSLLGVFSSTNLPSLTQNVARLEHHLFMLTDSGELYQSDLTNSAVFDTSAAPSPLFEGVKFNVLTGNLEKIQVLDSNHKIYTISLNNSNIPVSGTAFETLPSISNLKNVENTLFGWNSDGDLYQISEDQTRKIASFPSVVLDVEYHDDQIYITTKRHSVYTISDGNPVALRTTSEARHKLVSADNNLYLSSFNDIYSVRYDSTKKIRKPVITVHDEKQQQEEIEKPSADSWKLLKPESKFTITYPRPFILHLETSPASLGPELTYNVQSNISGISFEENNLYYKPSASDIGTHPVKVIATDNSGNADSVNIVLDVRAFNRPPRFTPIRKLSIGVGENYELQIRAIDPDGQNKNLVRYVGLDMPQGATINEKTGLFSWTPSPRQVNTYQFRVIASDQYGTAASTDVTISVKDVQQVNN